MEIDKLLTAEEVSKQFAARGIKLSSRRIREMAKDGSFTAPITINNRKHYWKTSDIDKWLESKRLVRENNGA